MRQYAVVSVATATQEAVGDQAVRTTFPASSNVRVHSRCGSLDCPSARPTFASNSITVVIVITGRQVDTILVECQGVGPSDAAMATEQSSQPDQQTPAGGSYLLFGSLQAYFGERLPGRLPDVAPAQGVERIERIAPPDAALPKGDDGRVHDREEQDRVQQRCDGRAGRRPSQSPREDRGWEGQ
jgi:hypothetical protein